MNNQMQLYVRTSAYFARSVSTFWVSIPIVVFQMFITGVVPFPDGEVRPDGTLSVMKQSHGYSSVNVLDDAGTVHFLVSVYVQKAASS